MTLPSSGQISLKDILDEKQGSTTARTNISLKGLSVDSVADSSGGDITINANSGSNPPNQTEPYQASEFHSYNHSFTPAVPSWSDSDGVVSAPTNNFDFDGTRDEGLTCKLRQEIKLNWNSNPANSTVQFRESDTGASQMSTNGMNSSFNTVFGPNLGISNSTNWSGITKIEARWKLVSVNITSVSANSNDEIRGYVVPGGSLSTGSYQFHNGSQSNVTNHSETQSSWVDITPTIGNISGGGATTQTHYLELQATATGTSDQIKVSTDGAVSSEYIALELRLNQNNSEILQLRSATTVDIEAISYDPPDFTCIMPDMLVEHETKGFIRIGDVVVGDRIRAQGDLSDISVKPQYVEVTEARTHTRSGYWNVEGIHITNDHPVWLTDESSSAWVKVEDMRADVNRTYVAGTVDPVYLGTNPGWYYVWSADRTKGFTVSGNYAPTTE